MVLENFDTNVNNYSREELFNIIELSPTTNGIIIKNKIEKIIKQLNPDTQLDLIEFFENVKKRLLKDQRNQEDAKKTQSEFWLQNQFLPRAYNTKQLPGPPQLDFVSSRANKVDTFNEGKPVMNRKRLNIANSIPIGVGQDDLNPTLQQIITRTVILDSSNRPNIISKFSEYKEKNSNNSIDFRNDDPNDISLSSQYTCNLSVSLKNVLKMRVNSVFIPNTFNVFDRFRQNIFFWVEKKGEKKQIAIEIPEGNYEFKINILQDKINFILKETIKKATKKQTSDLNIQIEEDRINPRLKFVNNSTDNDYIVTFYDFDNLSSRKDQKCFKPFSYYSSLGYYLGFRLGIKSDDEKSDNSVLPRSWKIEIPKKNGIDDGEYIAQTSVLFQADQFFKIAIEDFNNNQTTSSLVSIIQNVNKISLPSYANKAELVPLKQEIPGLPNPNCFKNPINKREVKQFLPIFPRKLTLNQLYSINEILLNQKSENFRPDPANDDNVLALIPVSNIINTFKNPAILSNQFFEREYFGPVLIERLRVSLYDLNGILVNLNNHNWTITLSIDELYQY